MILNYQEVNGGKNIQENFKIKFLSIKKIDKNLLKNFFQFKTEVGCLVLLHLYKKENKD